MENIYYKFLNLPFSFDKPKEFIDSPLICQIGKEMESSRNTTLMTEFLKQFNLYISNAEGFYTIPGGKIPIHTDGLETCKINITWGPGNGLIRFYKPEKIYQSATDLFGVDTSKVNKTEYGDEISFAKEENSKLICEVNTNRPTLLNVQEYHGTYNPSEVHGRWTLSYLIVDENDEVVSWFEVVEILKDYIEEPLV